MNMNKAFIHARKSTEEKKKQILSLDDQLHECREIAAKSQLTVTDDGVFVEAKTGWKADARTEFYRMLELIKRGVTDTIICWNLDRIGRNGQDNGTVRDLITQGRLKIITPTTTYDTTNTLKVGLENLVKEEYSKKLSEVVKARLKLKAERGQYPSLAPLGYKNTPQREKGKRIILTDKKRWELCRRWWDYMLTGIYTVEQTLELITADGLRNKRNKIISRTKAYAFFRDIFYTGNFEYSGTVYPGTHKQMVTITEWVKVQQIIDKKGKRGAYTVEAAEEKTFQGMLKCGECGAAITMERHIKNYKNGNSQTFWYYRCTKKLGHCSQPCLNAKEFKPQVEDYISRLELNPRFGDWVKNVLKRRNAQEFNFERKSQELKTKRLADITDRKEKIYGMKIDGLYSREEYEKAKKELLIEEKQLRESYLRPTTTYWEKVIENTINFATSVSQLF